MAYKPIQVTTYTIPEIIKMVGDAETRAEKIDILLSYQSVQLKELLKHAFHPDIKFLIPKGFKWEENPAPLGYSPTNLQLETRRLYLFTEYGKPDISQEKREDLFLSLVENLHPSEAQFLYDVTQKNMKKYKSLTYSLVSEAFPNIIPPLKKGK